MTTVFDEDLVIDGREQVVDDDVVVNGWVEIARGRLVCKNLSCLGLSIDDGGALECAELLCNFVEVDNSNNNTDVDATWVRARVVHLVQRGMEALVNRGDVTADYVQHFGRDLNPSWDYVRGRQLLLAKYYESKPDDENAPVLFDVAGIRKALALDQPVFRKPGPLVSLWAPAQASTPRPPADETVAELTAWIKAHPGPQRETLAALSEWLPRLKPLSDEAKAQADRVIRRTIKSPKLSEQRGRLLGELAAPAPTSAEPRHAAPAVRLVRAARPDEYLRPRPDAWLEAFAIDTDRIEVYGNPEVQELPARIADFTRLSRLTINGTRLSRIAPELTQCTTLEDLNLSGNELEQLPEGIGQLRALRSLNVESNRSLSRLPDSVCALRNLRQLSLGHTQLGELPADFGELSELHYLSLNGCRNLSELPESFFKLPKLDSLYLHGTRFRADTLSRIRETFPECNFWNFF